MIVQPEVSSIVVKLPHPLAVQTVLSRLPSTSPPLTPLSPGLETSSTSTTNVTTAQQHPPKLNDLNCLNTHISNISVNNSQLTATTTTTTTTPTTTPPWLQTQNCNQLPLSISIESNSSSLPITSTPDSPLSLSQDTKECSTVAEDHFYCRRETTGSTLSHPAPESLIVLQSSGTSAGAEVSASTVSPEVDTEIKRFFLQRHPDGRLLLVPIVETIVATTTTEPVVVDNSPTPRSPLFRIALADSSSGQFPVVATTELNDPISSPSFVFTATLLSSTTSSGQIPISGSTALASPPISSTASAVRTGQDTPTLVATSSTAAVNNTTPQQASTSTELATASQTSTMTSYVFTSQQQLTSANNGGVSFEHHHQPQHELALPPVETIFSQQHPQQHIMQTRGSGGGATPLGFGDFDPLFSNMVDDQQSFRGPTTVFSDHHIDYYGQVDSTTTLIEDDDDDELLSASKCLPFGYYYDNQKIFNKLEMISSSLPSSTTSSSSPLLDALEINDLFSNSTTTNSGSLSQSQQQQQQQQQSQHHALSHPHHAQNVHQPQPQQQQLQQMHQHATQQQQNIKQEFAGEQFQAFTSSSLNHNTGSGYGMVGYGQDPLISGRTTVMHQKCSPTALIQIKSEIKTEDEDEEILSMLDIGWMNNVTGQIQNGIGDVPHQSFGGPNQQHNTISSTSSPTIVNGGSEFWNGGQSALQSPTIATTSGQATGESPMFEDLLVPELDDSSLEIENILSQNPMFGSPPKLSNCLVKDQTQAQHFARPSFVRQQQQHPQQQRQTALGELLLRNSNNSDSMAPVLVQNQQTSGVNKAMTVAITTNSGLQQQQQQPPTATIHHRPQHPTPMQQQNRSMQNYCPTLAALITRPTPNGGGGGADISHTQGLNSSSSSSVQPQHHQLRNLIAHQLTMHSSRNRNNSMSTDYSISSHDEGFASQQEDGSESDESAILSLQPEHDTLEGEMFYMDMGPTAHPMMSSMSSNGVLQTAPQQQAQQQHSSPSMQMMATPIQQQQPQQQQMQCDFMFQQPTTSYEDAEMHLGPSSTSDDDEEEEEDDDDDESFYGDYNAEDLLGATTSDDVNNKWSLNMGRSRKGSEKRYFWQYNVQSKGPKAPKYTTAGTSLEHEGDDPHIFREISDPVFAPDCQVEGVKHSGKARRGDGNDLTPNPKKLLMIGLELKKLSKIINDLTPVTDVPVVCRNDTRKEKNKLASRACRLKKKAQHEANKIKLHGLHREHNKLMRTIGEIKKIVQASVKVKDNQQRTPMLVQLSNNIQLQVGLTSDVNTLVNDTIARNKPILEIGSHTADFVNHVLDNVSAGVANGGIDDV